AELVADIVPGVASSNPSHFVVVNNRLFFVADDGVHGPELWTSDGTATNTALVKDINPGSGGSLNPVNARLINVGRTVCFVADDGEHGPEVWRSDGTADGTVLVADIALGSDSVAVSMLTDVASALFFRGAVGGPWADHDWGLLYKSDGTPDGTVL